MKKHKWIDINQQIIKYETSRIYPGLACFLLLFIVLILTVYSITVGNVVMGFITFLILLIGIILIAIYSASQGIICPNCKVKIQYYYDNTSKIDILKNMHQCPECQYKFDDNK